MWGEDDMRIQKNLMVAIGAALLASACVAYGPDGYLEYDGYYDGYYGPYSTGYWGIDGFFYYSDRGQYVRDDGHHYRHQQFNGGRRFQGEHRHHR